VSFARLPLARFLQLMASGERTCALHLLIAILADAGNRRDLSRVSVLFSVPPYPSSFFGRATVRPEGGLLAAFFRS